MHTPHEYNYTLLTFLCIPVRVHLCALVCMLTSAKCGSCSFFFNTLDLWQNTVLELLYEVLPVETASEL